MIFSIAMGADHSFYMKTIETHARAFLPLNISAIGTVHRVIDNIAKVSLMVEFKAMEIF